MRRHVQAKICEKLIASNLRMAYILPMTMTSEDFNAWLDRMGRLRGKDRLSEREAAELLGWTREALRPRINGTRAVPRYIELACRLLEIMERAKAP
jgi:hypothetical protein